MPITSRHWERTYAQLPISHALVPSAAQPVTFVSDTVGLTTPTVLRTRHFPQFTYNCTSASVVRERAANGMTVQFVVWADQIVPSPTPDMLSVDSRILATAYMTPRYQPAATTPTTGFSYSWVVDGGTVESFAQRKTDPTNTNPLTVYSAIFPIDWSFVLYTANAANEFTYYCAAEALYGGH